MVTYMADGPKIPFRVDEGGLHMGWAEAQLIHHELTDAHIDGSDPLLGQLHADLGDALNGDDPTPETVVSLSLDHIVGLRVYYLDVARGLARERHLPELVYMRYAGILSRLIPAPRLLPTDEQGL